MLAVRRAMITDTCVSSHFSSYTQLLTHIWHTQNWVGSPQHVACYSLPPPQTVVRRHQAGLSSSSLRDDFQIISENYLLARINMKTGGDWSGAGCGYRDCLHCLRSSPTPPPPLPPKPPWLRPPRPLSLAPTSEVQVETSGSSEASEQEPVIYSKNVKLLHQTSHSQVSTAGRGISW